jgi:vacuolar-type H+-ATPase subunit F/Vma7
LSRIITIGSEAFVTAFRLQGIDGFIASPSDFGSLIDTVVADESVAIVILEESLYLSKRVKMDNLKVSITRPLFIEIPTSSEDRVDIIKQLIQKNIGISLG